MIAALRTGDGVRLLTPAGVELRGRAATAALLAGARADRMPILLGGSSRGTMATGPHPFETWPEEEQERVGQRMVEFARAVALGKRSVPDARPWSNMKELAATASDVWEPSTQPLTH